MSDSQRYPFDLNFINNIRYCRLSGVYYRFEEDLRYRENRRLVNDLISGVCNTFVSLVYNRFEEDLRYRVNKRLVNDLIRGV